MSELENVKAIVKCGELALNNANDCQSAIAYFLNAIANLMVMEEKRKQQADQTTSLDESVKIWGSGDE